MPAVQRGVTDSVVCFHGGHVGKFDVSKGESQDSHGTKSYRATNVSLTFEVAGLACQVPY